MKRLLAVAMFAAACSSGRTMHVPACRGGELPLVALGAPESPAAAALVLTGDGGWRAIDAEVSEVLREHRVAVTGFLANDYFDAARTVDETACDLDRAIGAALARARASRIILVGFSRGAETLALAIPHLPAATRARVDLAALLGPSRTASLHRGRFGRAEDNVRIDGRALVDAASVLCVHGDRERETLCSSLTASAEVMVLPGGHHFGGSYRAIGERIVASSRRATSH